MLTRTDYPILEYDSAPDAVINPRATSVRHEGLPEGTLGCVLSYMNEPVEALVKEGRAKPAAYLHGTTGRIPVYAIEEEGTPLAITVCPPGAPLAAAFMEEIHAMGVTRFISCGGAGVLNRELAMGHFLLPERALRDEGTSYHYQPPARFIEGDSQMLGHLEAVIREEDFPYRRTTTWTTDAFYRETREKVDLRRAEGCTCVEMECSAYMAVAKHRGLSYAALLYAADNLDGEIWDHRDWHASSSRSLLVRLCLKALASMKEGG